jgi:membrane protease YdiL (CAAX protease family)
VIVIGLHNGKKALQEWLRTIFRFRIPALLYLAGAFLLPIAFGGLHYLLYRLFGGAPDFENAFPWYYYLAYLIPTALLTGGNEEPGWRGFALPALLQWFHPVIASLVLGVIHSFWHLPLMGHYGTKMGWYLFNLIPLTFLFNWFSLVSQKSIIPVMLFHASTNVLSSFIPTPDVVLNGLGTYMFLRGLAYWILTAAILIFTRGRLGYGKPTQDSACSEPTHPVKAGK